MGSRAWAVPAGFAAGVAATLLILAALDSGSPEAGVDVGAQATLARSGTQLPDLVGSEPTRDDLERLRAELATLVQALAEERALRSELENELRGLRSQSNGRAALLEQLEAPLAWLRELAPDKFGDMTAEQLLHLRELDLSGLDVADDDLAALEHLPSLRDLTLRGTAVGDPGLERLARLSLRHLGLRQTQISDAGMEHLRDHPTLQRLDLNTTAVGDAGLVHLTGNERLEFLRLNYTQITDAGLSTLASLRALERVDLWGLQITDEGLSMLWDHPALVHLEVGAVPVSKAWVEDFQAAHPHCYVRSRWGR